MQLNKNDFRKTIIYVTQLLIVCVAAPVLVACNPSDDSQSSMSNDTRNSAGVSDSKNIEMLNIPAGKFIRGSEKEDTEGIQQRYGFPNTLYKDERPRKKIHVDAFLIDKFEVSNSMYKTYIRDSNKMMPFAWVNNGYALSPQQLDKMDIEKLRKIATDYMHLDIDTRNMEKLALIKAMSEYQDNLDKFPVGGVNWFDAKAYCKWRSARLPMEVEWEKAARGTKGQEFPWGNEWDPQITNTGDDGKWEEGMAPIGSYPKNLSPYGVYDMAGNVWEWVEDWYDVYPGSDYSSPLFGKSNRVIRGGGGGVGHYAISYFFRASTRQFSEPEMESDDVGFRCAKDA